MLDENAISEIWLLMKEYIDKKNLEIAAEKYIDLLADCGLDEPEFKASLGSDTVLDSAIYYYLDIDSNDDEWDE